jgi:hypothetical protein
LVDMTSQLRVADAGQSHDRFWAAVDEDNFAGSTNNMAVVTENQAVSDANAGEIEITVGQKMISATSGSLLTSLLGMDQSSSFPIPQNCRLPGNCIGPRS